MDSDEVLPGRDVPQKAFKTSLMPFRLIGLLSSLVRRRTVEDGGIGINREQVFLPHKLVNAGLGAFPDNPFLGEG